MTKKPDQLLYINILKVISCWSVFFGHLTGCISLKWLSDMRDFVAPHFLLFFMDGNMSVLVFFVISGFLMGVQYGGKEINRNRIRKNIIKRPIFLFLSCAIIVLVGWILKKSNLFFDNMAYINGADGWILSIFCNEANIDNLILSIRGIYDQFGNSLFSPQLWTIHYEIRAGVFILLIMLGIEKKTIRIIIEACILLLFYKNGENNYLAIFSGLLFGELSLYLLPIRNKVQLKSVYKILIMSGLLELSSNIYRKYYETNPRIFPIVLAIVIIIGFTITNPYANNMRVIKMEHIINKISRYTFSFYLIHFIVIICFGALLFGLISSIAGRILSYIIVLLAVTVLTSVISVLYQDIILHRINIISEKIAYDE